MTLTRRQLTKVRQLTNLQPEEELTKIVFECLEQSLGGKPGEKDLEFTYIYPNGEKMERCITLRNEESNIQLAEHLGQRKNINLYTAYGSQCFEGEQFLWFGTEKEALESTNIHYIVGLNGTITSIRPANQYRETCKRIGLEDVGLKIAGKECVEADYMTYIRSSAGNFKIHKQVIGQVGWLWINPASHEKMIFESLYDCNKAIKRRYQSGSI